jgi:hypothetical protein
VQKPKRYLSDLGAAIGTHTTVHERVSFTLSIARRKRLDAALVAFSEPYAPIHLSAAIRGFANDGPHKVSFESW